MRRLENGDIEVNGKVWGFVEVNLFTFRTHYERGPLRLMFRHGYEEWYLVETESRKVLTHRFDTPEECIEQVQLAARHAEEL